MSPSVATLEEFGVAIEAFPDTDRATIGWSADAMRCAQRSLSRHGLCLVGEVHGVAENPLVIERVVTELGVDVVALEWPRGLELAIDDLERLGAEPPSLGRPIGETSHEELAAAVAWCGDGRVTAGHFAVLRRVAARPVAVDEPITSGLADERDATMASNVEQLLREGSNGVVFVAGNLHTRLRPDAHYTPAGVHLARERHDLCALQIHYAQGRFWNLGPHAFHRAPTPPGPHLVVARATEAVVLVHWEVMPPPSGRAGLGV